MKLNIWFFLAYNLIVYLLDKVDSKIPVYALYTMNTIMLIFTILLAFLLLTGLINGYRISKDLHNKELAMPKPSWRRWVFLLLLTATPVFTYFNELLYSTAISAGYAVLHVAFSRIMSSVAKGLHKLN